MNSLYLDPEDLINLIANNSEFKPEQIHFHINYYEGIGKIHKRQEAFLALAACALLDKKFESCTKFLTNFTDSTETTFDYLYYFLSGLLQEKLEDYQKSIEHYIAATKAPQHSIKKPFLLRTHLLSSFIANQSYSQAIEFFSRTTEIDEDFKDVFVSQLGFCCEKLGKNEKAVEWYSMTVDGESIISQACAVWVLILQETDVRNILEEHIENSSENKFILCDWKFILSQYFIRKGEFDKAVEILKEICECVNKNEYFSALGLVFYKKQNIIQAFVHYLRALKLKKNLAENWFNLALIYSRVNQSESTEALKKAKSLDMSGIIANDLSGDLINAKFNFSLFGKPPASEIRIKKSHQRKYEVAESEKNVQEMVMPSIVPELCQFQGFPANVSITINIFYENLARLWNSRLDNRNFYGMNHGFNMRNWSSVVQPQEEPEQVMPVKRSREIKDKESKKRK